MDSAKAEKLAEAHVSSINIPATLKGPTKYLVKKMAEHPAFNNPSYEWTINDFEFGKRLGRGKFGRVYLAREKRTGFLVALKTLLKKELVRGRVEKQVLREIEIQTHLKHPNILQMLTYFHDDFRIYYVLEYAGKGELYRHLKTAPDERFDEPTSAKYIYQVADALNYCHENNVIHRDIKPENLLLTITDDVKIADFGWSIHKPSMHSTTMCGTTDYIPPEMLTGRSYKHLVDNWCLGVLCFEFLTGSPPFEDSNSDLTFKRIKTIDYQFPPYVGDEARDLISKLLVYTAVNRLSLPEVMIHPWVVKNRDKKVK